MRYSILGWIVIGLLVGWLTSKVTRESGFGLFANLFVGLVGAVIGGWIFEELGISFYGIIGSLAAATAGAVVEVSLARLFSGRSK